MINLKAGGNWPFMEFVADAMSKILFAFAEDVSVSVAANRIHYPTA